MQLDNDMETSGALLALSERKRPVIGGTEFFVFFLNHHRNMNFKWQIYIDIIYSIMFSWTAIIIRIFVSLSSVYYRNIMWFVGYIEAAKSYSCSTLRDLISAIRESMMTELLARNRLLHWCMAGVFSITGIVSYAPRQSLKTVTLPICKHGNGNECC